MRELERTAADSHPVTPVSAGPSRIGLVGRGRLGTALAAALRRRGVAVDGPAGRGEVPEGEALLLCVPDAEIPAAAAVVAGRAPLVGHTSGATPLAALEPARRDGTELFGLHPLQTFPSTDGHAGVADRFEGAGCAVAGSTAAATGAARAIARRLGMTPFELADGDRAAYHAAASLASNYIVTLGHAAESIAAGTGLEPARARAMLEPLVRATVDNWSELGPVDALTGPVARGDEQTIAAQRAAIERVAPSFLPLFDALVERTRALAAHDGATPLAAAAGVTR